MFIKNYLFTVLTRALAQNFFFQEEDGIRDDGESGEHEYRDPDESNFVGRAGIEDGAAKPVLRRDELADDRAGQRKPDVDPQHRDDPRHAERHHELAEHLPPAPAKQKRKLLAV